MAGGSTAFSGAGQYYSDPLWHRYNGIRCGVFVESIGSGENTAFPGGRKGYCSGIDAGSSEGFITSGRKKEFRRSHRASGRRKWKKHRTGEDDVSGETYNIFMEHKAERSAVGTDMYCRLDQHFRNSALLFCVV